MLWGVQASKAIAQERPQTPATTSRAANMRTWGCGVLRAYIACMLPPPIRSVRPLHPSFATERDDAELCILDIPVHCIPHRLCPLTTEPMLLDSASSRACSSSEQNRYVAPRRRCRPYPGTVVGQVNFDVSIWCACPCMLECAGVRACGRACGRAGGRAGVNKSARARTHAHTYTLQSMILCPV